MRFNRTLTALMVGLGTLFSYLLYRAQAVELLLQSGDIETQDEWVRLGPSPDGDEGYPPQGITVVGDELILSNHWDGERSVLYRVDSDSGTVRQQAAMPEEAAHTSGLTWDGEWLWAVDHASNTLYKLSLEETFATGNAVVEQRIPTGLRGSSGLTVIEIADTEYFAISDFIWTIETAVSLPVGSAATYIAPRKAVEDSRTVRTAATIVYPNSGYSQGLTWDGTYLYESLNNRGTDRIEVIDISDAVSDEDGQRVNRVASFEGPAARIEDLATDGESLWTTDEGTYDLYRLDSLAALDTRF